MEDCIIMVWVVITYMYERIYDVENYVIKKKFKNKGFWKIYKWYKLFSTNFIVKIIKQIKFLRCEWHKLFNYRLREFKVNKIYKRFSMFKEKILCLFRNVWYLFTLLFFFIYYVVNIINELLVDFIFLAGYKCIICNQFIIESMYMRVYNDVWKIDLAEEIICLIIIWLWCVFFFWFLYIWFHWLIIFLWLVFFGWGLFVWIFIIIWSSFNYLFNWVTWTT